MEPVDCDGGDFTITLHTQCTIPLTTLTAVPFNLALGNTIYAKVIAYNYYGDSEASEIGAGSVIQLVPNAPINLLNNPTITSSFVIGFSWADGSSDGGSPILDYKITYDQSTLDFIELISGLTDSFYQTTIELISGRNY